MDIKSQVNRRGKERREEGKGEENEDDDEKENTSVFHNFSLAFLTHISLKQKNL